MEVVGGAGGWRYDVRGLLGPTVSCFYSNVPHPGQYVAILFYVCVYTLLSIVTHISFSNVT